jgi:fumarate hydratase class II
MKIPLYGDQTLLALQNFPISGWTIPSELIHALALIKEKAADVNGALGQIPKSHAGAIARAARKIKAGKYDVHFPVDVFQTGSGTSTNMNMNEVIATLATGARLRVHPNDHVNKGQSSNDTFPSAVQIGAAIKIRRELIPALQSLRSELVRKSRRFHGIIKTARTHLMDAVPIRLGAEFAGYASLLQLAIGSLRNSSNALRILPLGGTAVGTGLNTHPRFASRVIAKLRKETGIGFAKTTDHVALQSCPLAFLGLSSALREVALVLNKIADDIRLMASGSVAGLNEITLPSLQPGSSIMPGKVNPVLCESVMQVSMYIEGADVTVHAGLKQGSQFELNTALPVIAQSLFVSMRLLTNVARIFTEKCVMGIEANKNVIEHRTDRNPMLVTPLASIIGYDLAAAIVREAAAEGKTIAEIASKRTEIPSAELKKLLDPAQMV